MDTLETVKKSFDCCWEWLDEAKLVSRATWVCPACGKDVSLEYVIMHEANISRLSTLGKGELFRRGQLQGTVNRLWLDDTKAHVNVSLQDNWLHEHEGFYLTIPMEVWENEYSLSGL